MNSIKERYLKRKIRSKKRIVGTQSKPRLYVFRSLKHIYANLIDDVTGKTILSVGSKCKEINKDGKITGNIKGAQKVGLALAKKALEMGIRNVVFDRGGRIYHGRVKALAEGAREGGLKI